MSQNETGHSGSLIKPQLRVFLRAVSDYAVGWTGSGEGRDQGMDGIRGRTGSGDGRDQGTDGIRGGAGSGDGRDQGTDGIRGRAGSGDGRDQGAPPPLTGSQTSSVFQLLGMKGTGADSSNAEHKASKKETLETKTPILGINGNWISPLWRLWLRPLMHCFCRAHDPSQCFTTHHTHTHTHTHDQEQHRKTQQSPQLCSDWWNGSGQGFRRLL
ncbi:unnamed protein product [Leuciscus chuanchicus]